MSEPSDTTPTGAPTSQGSVPARASPGEAARWFALGVLGFAAIAGLVVAIFFRQPREALIRSVTRAPAPRAVQGTSPTRADPVPETQTQPQARPAAREPTTPGDSSPEANGSSFGLVKINVASQAELELLPGIGPAMAQRILEHRAAHGPFRSIKDLDAIRGIGPRTLERLQPLISFE